MGHPVVQTPHLDRLASESMVYARGYTPTSVCRPSLATMVTGRYPHQHGITGNDPPGGSSAIRDPAARAEMVEVFQRSETVLELLHAQGYLSHQDRPTIHPPSDRTIRSSRSISQLEEVGRMSDTFRGDCPADYGAYAGGTVHNRA